MDYAAAYRQMHERSEKHFSGYSIRPYVSQIAELVQRVQPRRILDYGSGKGYQYLGQRVHDQWGGLLPHCYDPGVRQLSERPHGTFEGLICTDVMEHIEAHDVPDVLDDAFGFIDPHAHAFAFFAIACRPAKSKKLPDGRNVHLTVKRPDWWQAMLAKHERPGLVIRAEYDEAEI